MEPWEGRMGRMNRIEKVLLWGGAVVGYGKTLLRLANTVIGLGGFPGDVAGWKAIFNTVVGGNKVLDWLLLLVGTACLLLAFSPHLRRLVRLEKAAPPRGLTLEARGVHHSPEGSSSVQSVLDDQTRIGSAVSQAARSGLATRFDEPEEPETPIWVALEKIAGRIGDGNSEEGFPKARQQLRQAALNGRVTLWGREQINPQSIQDNRHRDVSAPIPKVYWNDYRINREAAAEANENEAHTEYEDLPSSLKGRYWRIRAYLKEINDRWQQPEEPILYPAPPPPEERQPPLKEAERMHCRAALIDLSNFLTGDLTNFHAALVKARNSDNVKDLKAQISSFGLSAAQVLAATKVLHQKHWTWLYRMGDSDDRLKVLTERLAELQQKIGAVHQGIRLGVPQQALMESVRPMHNKNLEVGKLGKALIQWTQEKEAEFFGD